MAQVSKYRYLLNQYPETVQKEQFRIICHISKRTARYLLQSGLVPCVQSGKKTRNYTIKMKDIVRYNKEYLGYVCVDVIGNLIKPNYVSSTFGKLLAKNNLRHIRFHDLRHTCASLLLANGVPMEQVKEWLGHSEISTTVDIYGHLQYATKKQSAAAIEQDIVAPMLQNLSAVSP